MSVTITCNGVKATIKSNGNIDCPGKYSCENNLFVCRKDYDIEYDVTHQNVRYMFQMEKYTDEFTIYDEFVSHSYLADNPDEDQYVDDNQSLCLENFWARLVNLQLKTQSKKQARRIKIENAIAKFMHKLPNKKFIANKNGALEFSHNNNIINENEMYLFKKTHFVNYYDNKVRHLYNANDYINTYVMSNDMFKHGVIYEDDDYDGCECPTKEFCLDGFFMRMSNMHLLHA